MTTEPEDQKQQPPTEEEVFARCLVRATRMLFYAQTGRWPEDVLPNNVRAYLAREIMTAQSLLWNVKDFRNRRRLKTVQDEYMRWAKATRAVEAAYMTDSTYLLEEHIDGALVYEQHPNDSVA